VQWHARRRPALHGLYLPRSVVVARRPQGPHGLAVAGRQAVGAVTANQVGSAKVG
jgi:hypothetical protein